MITKLFYILSLQDDHKLSIDDLGKRYGLDISRVTTHTHAYLYRHTYTQAQSICFSIPYGDVISACLYWKATFKLRPSVTLVKLDPQLHLQGEPSSSLIPQWHTQTHTHKHTHLDRTTCTNTSRYETQMNQSQKYFCCSCPLPFSLNLTLRV